MLLHARCKHFLHQQLCINRLAIEVEVQLALGVLQLLFGQCGDLRLFEPRAEPRTSIEFQYLFKSKVRELAFAITGAVERVVVQQHMLTIFGDTHIDLSPGDEV